MWATKHPEPSPSSPPMMLDAQAGCPRRGGEKMPIDVGQSTATPRGYSLSNKDGCFSAPCQWHQLLGAHIHSSRPFMACGRRAVRHTDSERGGTEPSVPGCNRGKNWSGVLGRWGKPVIYVEDTGDVAWQPARGSNCITGGNCLATSPRQ